jgi:acyl-CoA reductase-like NAD-dependent aldehyde dehydrogenase
MEGAVCHTGGTVTTDGKSFGKFLEPTILTQCEANMGIVQNQMQCPVLCCAEVADVEEFIKEM